MPSDLEHPRLDWLLDNWVIYHHVGGAQHLKVKTARYWQSGNSDADKMVAGFDRKDAIATDAAIWDCSPVEVAAIMHVHLAAVWRMNRERIEDVYERARVRVSEGLWLRDVP